MARRIENLQTYFDWLNEFPATGTQPAKPLLPRAIRDNYDEAELAYRFQVQERRGGAADLRSRCD